MTRTPRAFPDIGLPIAYGPADAIRTVTVHGSIRWQGRRYFISRGLVGEPVALRPTREADAWEVIYGHRRVATIDLTDSEAV